METSGKKVRQGTEFRRATWYLNDMWVEDVFWKASAHGGDYVSSKDIKRGKIIMTIKQKREFIRKILTTFNACPKGSRLVCLPKQEGPLGIDNVRPIAVPEQGVRVKESLAAEVLHNVMKNYTHKHKQVLQFGSKRGQCCWSAHQILAMVSKKVYG